LTNNFSGYFGLNSRRARCPFANLPSELCLLILTYAARPIFTHRPEKRNPYSSALTLCLVSTIVRRTVLPELLHTILLSAKIVKAFLHALQVQSVYAQEENHLDFDYAVHARRVCIGEAWATNKHLNHDRFLTYLFCVDCRLLTPVLLASQSLVIDTTTLTLKSANLLRKARLSRALR
jgi:hypothetical protein